MPSLSRDEREFERTSSRSFAKWFLIMMAASLVFGLLMGIVWLLLGLWQSGRL